MQAQLQEVNEDEGPRSALNDRLATERPRYALNDKRPLTSFAVRLIWSQKWYPLQKSHESRERQRTGIGKLLAAGYALAEMRKDS